MKFPINEFDLLKIQYSQKWFLLSIGCILWKHQDYSALFQIMCLDKKWTVEILYYRLFIRLFIFAKRVILLYTKKEK